MKYSHIELEASFRFKDYFNLYACTNRKWKTNLLRKSRCKLSTMFSVLVLMLTVATLNKCSAAKVVDAVVYSMASKKSSIQHSEDDIYYGGTLNNENGYVSKMQGLDSPIWRKVVDSVTVVTAMALSQDGSQLVFHAQNGKISFLGVLQTADGILVTKPIQIL